MRTLGMQEIALVSGGAEFHIEQQLAYEVGCHAGTPDQRLEARDGKKSREA